MLFNCNNLFWDFVFKKPHFNPSNETELNIWEIRFYSVHNTWVFARKAKGFGHLQICEVQRACSVFVCIVVWVDWVKCSEMLFTLQQQRLQIIKHLYLWWKCVIHNYQYLLSVYFPNDNTKLQICWTWHLTDLAESLSFTNSHSALPTHYRAWNNHFPRENPCPSIHWKLTVRCSPNGLKYLWIPHSQVSSEVLMHTYMQVLRQCFPHGPPHT